MSTPTMPDRIPDVPVQIFHKFLEDLHEAGASQELVDELRKTLLQEKKYTEPALRKAILGPEAQQ